MRRPEKLTWCGRHVARIEKVPDQEEDAGPEAAFQVLRMERQRDGTLPGQLHRPTHLVADVTGWYV